MIATVKRNEIILQPSRCTGCKSCEIACSMLHTGSITPSVSKIAVETDHTSGYITIRFHSDCAYCAEPLCQAFCTTEAIRVVAKEIESLSVT